ncbi:hypothetical protein R1sor_017400 [Riccia sorocarpa]|uniref:Uncharacterized protein n=1 Tax=Riccia sorocarpa TaxID=122646 RepID=A0ABD3I6R4_9MARC
MASMKKDGPQVFERRNNVADRVEDDESNQSEEYQCIDALKALCAVPVNTAVLIETQMECAFLLYLRTRKTCRIFLLISENVSEENVVNLPGAVVDHIDSERLMFRSCHNCPPGNRRMRVLELGSGTGMVGIVAACLGAHVILTDLPHVIPNLEYNMELNRGAIQAAGGSVESRVLSWGVEEDIKTLGDLASFDLIHGL